MFLAPFGAWGRRRQTLSPTLTSARPSPPAHLETLTAINIGGGNSALIQFDLSGLPAGLLASQVSKATVTFFVNTVGTPGGIDVSQVTGAWTEGTVTFNTRPTFNSPFVSTFP